MTKIVNIWAPILKESDRPTMSLAVRCGQKAPTKEQYPELLQDQIDELIQENPARARRALGGNIVHSRPISDNGGVPTFALGSPNSATRRDGDVAQSN